jgi:hypothetical protein
MLLLNLQCNAMYQLSVKWVNYIFEIIGYVYNKQKPEILYLRFQVHI